MEEPMYMVTADKPFTEESSERFTHINRDPRKWWPLQEFERSITPQAILKVREQYPSIAEEFESLVLAQYQLFCSKMLDYGPGNISVGTKLETPEEVKLSLTGLYFRLSDKINRLKQLVALNKSPQVSEESVEDTFKDISIYGLIAQIVLNKKWK